MRALALAFALAAAIAPASPQPAAPAPSSVPGVVEIEPSASGDPDWAEVEDARGTTRLPQALLDYRRLHPHGEGAARAWLLQSAGEEDLQALARELRAARDEARGLETGARASLALARLEYDQGRAEGALAALNQADEWPRTPDWEAEWLYWRAQSRLVLRGYTRARGDFEALLKLGPSGPRSGEAMMGLAECSVRQGDTAAADTAYEALIKTPGPFTAGALWGLAALRTGQGRLDDARTCYQRLLDGYPASFEAHAAPGRLEALEALRGAQEKPRNGARKPPARTAHGGAARVRGSWWVQVDEFSARATAEGVAGRLRGGPAPAEVRERRVRGRLLYQVRELFASQGEAAAAAADLKSRDGQPHPMGAR